ncbi:LytR/AlgR family response regulator transcription factor [Thiohalomonas denitrificans]|uniref:Two component transcriptional regulator, LytTR family n=1 Tax=Thiohalomonas denitrificans TaxID=415747 RepID=A0A1G5QY10_9GAMM|nr:LytTR family DNA-binding domain-containing protein [Thiohalomonas denitrificans]SCZ66754.1 two component transcriptional regulator, LytTR family [Thiohalomonas denitrificans]
MIKVLIVDDEAPARSRLRRMLEGLDAEIIGEAADGESALKEVTEGRPDVVLLDVRMPGVDGLEAAHHLAGLDPSPAVIFTTAFEQHALEAFDLEAVDYLLKPVRRERLERALARVVERLPSGAGRPDSLRLHQRGGVRLLPFEAVFYFQADNKYVTVYYEGGEALLEQSLKVLAQQFGEDLVRIHRNALVVRERLLGMERVGGSYRAILEGTAERPEISRRHVSDVKALLEAASV